MTESTRSESEQGPAAARRPDGVTDEIVTSIGKASEAFEYIERARGHLYSFHQLMGHADMVMGEAANELRAAGLDDDADRFDVDIVGRNVLDGRWTFQVVEEYDDLYYGPVRDAVRDLERDHLGGLRHVFESEMKERRRTKGRAGHESRPPTAHSPAVETGE